MFKIVQHIGQKNYKSFHQLFINLFFIVMIKNLNSLQSNLTDHDRGPRSLSRIPVRTCAHCGNTIMKFDI